MIPFLMVAWPAASIVFLAFWNAFRWAVKVRADDTL